MNEYHQQRNRDASKEVEERLKHPSSAEEMKAQIQRLLNE